MSRWWIGLVFSGFAAAQQTPAAKAQNKSDDVQLPPDEDQAAKPKQYAFNPIQSNKEIQVGEFYFKKGDFRAAAGRFSEATKWNTGNAAAWLRLGEAEEKMKDARAAHDAYAKYLQIAPDGKNAPEVKKKLEKLKD